MNSSFQPPFRLRLFGTPAIEPSEGPPLTGRVAQRHRLAVLALLALAPAQRLSRDKLIAFLWPESDGARARNLLNVTIYILRAALGEAALVSTGDDLQLRGELVGSDVAEFETALRQGDPARAVAVYRAPFLDGFFLSEAPSFERWMEEIRGRLAGGYAVALESLAAEAEGRSDPVKAAEWWKSRAALDPYDSRVAARLIQALELSGNRAAALHHAALHQRLLHDELGIRTAPEIAALEQRLRTAPAVAASVAASETPAHPPLSPPAPPEPPSPSAADPRPVARSASGRPKAGLVAAGAAGAVLLVALVAAGLRLSRHEGDHPPAVPLHSIAVLPLENLGPADDEYFAAGMTDELTTRLTSVSSLSVVSRRAALRYAGTDLAPRDVGRELAADYLLVGTVRWSGSGDRAQAVRITLELVRAKDERQIWSATYDPVLDDIVEVQTRIAAQVIAQLGVVPLDAERRQVSAQPTGSAEAYRLYLKGRYFWNKRREADIQRALDHYQQAVDLDPGYALAWSGIADGWIFRGFYSRLAPAETFPKAKSAALRALQFDSTLSEAHASLAHIHFEFDHDWAAAEAEYRRAIALNPRNPVAHHWYGGFLSAMGRHEEALRQADTARGLDPLSPIIQTWVGLRYYFARQNPPALAEYAKALGLDRGFAPAHWHLGWAYDQAGRFADAIAEAEQAFALDSGTLIYLASVGHAYARAGRVEEARDVLARLAHASATRHVSAYHVAVIHAALADTATALDWLDRAVEERSPWIGYLNVDPRFDPVRSHPRFQRLLTRVRLR